MICDISMAQPRNVSVDAGHNVQFSFIFYGDGCNGADCFVYDADNIKYDESTPKYYLHDHRRKYYNGEQIDINTYGSDFSGMFVNNKSYVWKVRLYENMDMMRLGGADPSNEHERTEVVEPPFIIGTVKASEGTLPDEKMITIDKGLNVTLPAWMTINGVDEKRQIASYDPETGIIKTKNKFTQSIPTVSGKYTISTVYSVTPTQSDIDGKIYLPKRITCLHTNLFNRTVLDPTVTETHIWWAKIDDNLYAIEGYNYFTGLLTLENENVTFDVGTKVILLSSFIDSNFFAIDTRPTPKFTNTHATFDGENIHFMTELVTPHIVEKYWWEIYEDDVLLETTKEIYMGKLDYYFTNWKQGRQYTGVVHVVTQDGMVNQEDSSWWTGSSSATNICAASVGLPQDDIISTVCAVLNPVTDSVNLVVCSQKLLEQTLSVTASVGMYYINIGSHDNITEAAADGLCLVIGEDSYQVSSYNQQTGVLSLTQPLFRIYPRETAYSVHKIRSSEDEVKFRVLRSSVHGVELVGDFSDPIITDYICSANTEYEYIINPFTLYTTPEIKPELKAKLYKSHTSNKVTIKLREVAIYGLIPQPFVKYTNDDTRIDESYQVDSTMYKVDEFWGATLDMDAERGVTQNLNRTVYSGDKKKPIAVVGKNDYDTFSLTFTLGSIVCSGNRVMLGTIDDIMKWKKFIGKGQLLLIKAPDGEIWAGHITSHNYTKVYSSNKVQYKVTVEFTELVSIGTMRVAE